MWIGFGHLLSQFAQHCHLVGGPLEGHLVRVRNALDQPPQGKGQAVGPGEVPSLGAVQGFVEGSEVGVCGVPRVWRAPPSYDWSAQPKSIIG